MAPGISPEQWRARNEASAKKYVQLFSTRSPEWMVWSFVTIPPDSGTLPSGRFEAYHVSGANWQSPDLRSLANLRHDLDGNGRTDWQLAFYGDSKPKGDTTQISALVGYSDSSELTIRSHERVNLRRETVNGYKIWRIVPPKPEKIFTNGPHIADNGPINRMAAYIAYPKQAQMWLASRTVQKRLKKLSMGLVLGVQDYDGRLPKAESLRETLEAYVPDKSSYKSPLDYDSDKTLTFNKNLSGAILDDVKDPSKVVSFYDGQNMKLAFRYNGLAAVGFLDGHVEMVNPTRAKSLRWK